MFSPIDTDLCGRLREIFDWAFGTMDAYVRVGCIDGYLAKAAATRGSKKGKAQ